MKIIFCHNISADLSSHPCVLFIGGVTCADTVSFVIFDFPYHSKQHNIWNETALVKYNASFTFNSYFNYGALRIFDEIYSSKNYSNLEIGKRLSEEKTYKIKAGEEFLEFTAKDGGIAARMRIGKLSDNE